MNLTGFLVTLAVFYLPMLAALYFTNRTGAKPNGNILLGVTLPYDTLSDSDVADIVKRYKKACSAVCGAFLLLALPTVFFGAYMSVFLMYIPVWLTAFVVCNQKTVAKYWNELYCLKKERGWWTGKQSVISIDTEVSRLKDTFPVSKKWFLIPLCISIIPPIVGLIGENREPVFWTIQLCGLVTLMILFLFHIAYGRDRTVVYSDNTEVNLALNRVYKREWTRCFAVVACMNSIVFAAVSYFLMFNINQAGVAIAVISLLSLCVVIPIVYAFNKVRDMRNKLLKLINEEVYTDDDEYWVFGTMFYNNPNDKRAIVEKRIGYGMTTNLASWLGKVTYAVLIGAAVFFIGLALYIMPLDFGSVSLTVNGQTAYIQAAMYDYTFMTDEIKSVTLMDEFPRSTKINGANSSIYSVGRFSVSGHGASHVYIRHNNPPYIAIELERGWVFLNGSTREQTETYFNKLIGESEQ